MPIAKEPYGQLPDGTEIDLYTLTNAAGLRVTVITYGAILAEVVVPDRDGKMVNVNLGRDSLADYVADNSPYLGATVGRCAGRIARGTFTLNGKEYSLALNDGGKHHIHGGWKGFDKVAWKARPSDGAAGVALAYVSADGEEGYPGRLSVQLTYSLSDANELKLEYDAACDKPTIVNLTNHAYWNLAGAGCGDVLGHELTIHADRFLEGDEDLLPAGSPQPVRNTPCDFTQPAAIGAQIAQLGLGYDNCYVLKKPGGEGSLSLAARRSSRSPDERWRFSRPNRPSSSTRAIFSTARSFRRARRTAAILASAWKHSIFPTPCAIPTIPQPCCVRGRPTGKRRCTSSACGNRAAVQGIAFSLRFPYLGWRQPPLPDPQALRRMKTYRPDRALDGRGHMKSRRPGSFSIIAILIVAAWASSPACNRDGAALAAEQPPNGRQVWPSQPPKDCPFEPSKTLSGVLFTGVHSDYHCGDTWYPAWAVHGNQYSPWTDGATDGVGSGSAGEKATTGNAVLIGDDPLRLTVRNTSKPQPASPRPYEGRYPCGSLVHNGVWYYGTYCLGPAGIVKHEGFTYNWPVLGPMPGFRISRDCGKTWTPSPLLPERPLFPEPKKFMGPVKMGCPHFVDFGRNMEHSPDGKAYLLGMGAEENDPKPRYANLSWITADQVYMARVAPSPENINDASKYEFFAGHDAQGKPVWSGDFARIQPLLDWNNNMGCATATYDPGLKKYLMCVTDGWPTCAKMNSYILEADRLTGPWRAGGLHEGLRRAGLLPQLPVEVYRRRRQDAMALLLDQFRRRLERDEAEDQPAGRALRLVPARGPAPRSRRERQQHFHGCTSTSKRPRPGCAVSTSPLLDGRRYLSGMSAHSRRWCALIGPNCCGASGGITATL